MLLSLLLLLVVTAIAIILLQDLFAAVMLSGIFSLLSAALFVVMDAVDVAFTEAAVGAGISTVLLLATLLQTSVRERTTRHLKPVPLAVVLLTGAALIYGTRDMPAFGKTGAPIHQHVAPRYIDQNVGGKTTDRQVDFGDEVPNMVTAVLASYRGYDTLGELAVIFTSAVGVLLLLGGRPKQDEEDAS